MNKDLLTKLPWQQIIVAVISAALGILGPALGITSVTTWIIAAISGSYLGAQGMASAGSQASLNSLSLFKSDKFKLTLITILATAITGKLGIPDSSQWLIGILGSILNLTKGAQDMVQPLAAKYISAKDLTHKAFPQQLYNLPERPKLAPLGIVFHQTGKDFEPSLNEIISNTSPVSYNVLIGPDGTQHMLYPSDQMTYHCGISAHNGRADCNTFMMSVAFTGSHGSILSPHELASAAQVVKRAEAKYPEWSGTYLVTHKQVEQGAVDLSEKQWNSLLDLVA